MADLNKIVEDLSSLTVLEAAELSKMLEEKWGVSAAAPAFTRIAFPEPVPSDETNILSSSTCDVVADVPIIFKFVL